MFELAKLEDKIVQDSLLCIFNTTIFKVTAARNWGKYFSLRILFTWGVYDGEPQVDPSLLQQDGMSVHLHSSTTMVQHQHGLDVFSILFTVQMQNCCRDSNPGREI